MKLQWEQGRWDHLITDLPAVLSDFEISAPGLTRVRARYERRDSLAVGRLAFDMRLQWTIDGRTDPYGVAVTISVHELSHTRDPLGMLRNILKGHLIDGFARYVK